MDPVTPPKHHYAIQSCDVPVPTVKFPSPRVKKGADPRAKSREARKNAGRKPLTEKFSKLIPCVKNLVEQNEFAAHARRRDDSGLSCGTTIPQIREHVLREVNGLQSISCSTLRHLFLPKQASHVNAARYKGHVNAKVAPKANDVRKDHQSKHFYAARVKYRAEFMSQFWKHSTICSADTMNKLPIGTLAVSRYHQLRAIFPVEDKPNFPDHDLPIGHGYKITPVGYLLLESKNPKEMMRDDSGRLHYQYPRTGPLYMRNTIQKVSPLTIQYHANNLVRVLSDRTSNGKSMLLLITDGGPDWSVKSWTVLLYLQRVFKRLDLDFLCLSNYAPGQSAFNPIEHAWSPLSRKLSGVTFGAVLEGESVPPCAQNSISEKVRDEKERKLFTRVLHDLDKYWNGMRFDGYEVKSQGSLKEANFDIFSDYNDIHELLSRGSLRQLEQRPDLLKELQFTISHSNRQPGEFSIWKCCSNSCKYCVAHPVKAVDAMTLLESLGGIPNPSDVDSRGTFSTYIEALQRKATGLPSLPDINECNINSELCENGCINTYGSYRCNCETGFEFDANFTCEDINECLRDEFCDQGCINVPGSFLCICDPGYYLDEDQRTCLGPAACIYEGALHLAGTTWQSEDGCEECTCDEGVTVCHDTQCPMSNDCEHYRVLYKHGSNWTALHDPCLQCSCDNGDVSCVTEVCDPRCSHPAPRQGECCRECNNCLYEGTLILNNRMFKPVADNCSVCECIENGDVQCIREVCNLDCPVPSYLGPNELPPPPVHIEGECCPDCGGGGANDHLDKQKHKKNAEEEQKAVGMSKKLTSFFQSENLSVIRAKVGFTDFLLEHSIPLAVSDHAGSLFKKMFPDSKIAKQYSSGRTKTRHIVGSLSKGDANHLAQCMKTQKFSLATDGSTDFDAVKLYPIVVKTFDECEGKVVCDLLAMKECSSQSTGENIFKILDNELTSWGISWANCISFGTDNASVMEFFRTESEMNSKRKANSDVINSNPKKKPKYMPVPTSTSCKTKRSSSVCSSDSAHKRRANPSLKSSTCASTSPTDDSTLGGLVTTQTKPSSAFKSPPASTALKTNVSCNEFDINKYLFTQQELAQKYSKTKKASGSSKSKSNPCKIQSTSKSVAITQSKTNPHKSTLIHERLANPSCKLHALFLKTVIPFFEHPNEVLQKDEPQIHHIHDILVEQLSRLLTRFVKPSAIVEASDITKLDISDAGIHKKDEDIQIGYDCKSYLSENKDKLNLKQFYTSVKHFYISSSKYMVEHYPFNDELLLHAQVVNIQKRRKVKFASVEYFVTRFNLVSTDSLDMLESEFNIYQVDLLDGGNFSLPIDQQRHMVAQLDDMSQKKKKYELLASVMKSVLVIFHSNKDCCHYNGIGYRNGARWQSVYNKCETCICISAYVVCEPISCATECTNPYQPEDACCPVCDDCVYRGQIIENGAYFNPIYDSCKTCSCINAEIVCHSPLCQIDCSNPMDVPGECCPACGGCTINGTTAVADEVFYPFDDKCTQCRCMGGSLSVCHQKPCLNPRCRPEYRVMSEDKCCPECVPGVHEKCFDDGMAYDNGTEINRNCNQCVCKNGEWRCSPQECPSLECALSNRFTPEGRCCPICRRNKCIIENVIYRNGTVFHLNNDPCHQCECIYGEAFCTEILCPPEDCPPQFLEIEEDVCCPKCSIGKKKNFTDGPDFSISIFPYNVEVNPGSKLEFVCSIVGDNIRDTPRWSGPDGSVISQNEFDRVHSERDSESSNKLVINNLQPSDSGVYTCFIDSVRHVVNTITVIVPEFRVNMRGQVDPTVGKRVNLVCEIVGIVPDLSPVWRGPNLTEIQLHQNGGTPPRVHTRQQSSRAVLLVIDPIVRTDGGSYTCVVGPVEATFTLLVQENKIIRIRIIANRNNHEVGQTADLTCEIIGDSPFVPPRWRLPSGQDAPDPGELFRSRVTTYQESETLTRLEISGLQLSDAGEYECVVGPVSATYSLRVSVPSCRPPCLNGGVCRGGICDCPPEFPGSYCQGLSLFLNIKKVSSGIVQVGANVRFECEVSRAGSHGPPEWQAPDGMVVETFAEVIQPSCIGPCQNGGACVNGQCQCLKGFVGTLCQYILPDDMDVTIIPVHPTPDEENPFIHYICEVAQDSIFQNPVWYKGNNTRIPVSQPGGRNPRKYVIPLSDRSTQLTILNPTDLDSGDYTCVVGHLRTNVRITIFLDDVCAGGCLNGGSCHQHGCSCRDGYTGSNCETPNPSRRVYTVRSSPYSTTLILSNIAPGDAGTYTCYRGSFTTTFTIQLTVPSYYIRIVHPPTTYFSVGHNVTLVCEVPVGSNYGSPMWMLPSGALIPEQGATLDHIYSRMVSQYVTHLIFQGLQLDDRGSYTCIAGLYNSTIFFYVREPRYTIRITGSTSNGTFTIGQSIQLVCEVSPYSVFKYPQWFGPNGDVIPEKGPGGSNHIFTISQNSVISVLRIIDVQREDAGNYTCIAGPYRDSLYIQIRGVIPRLRIVQNQSTAIEVGQTIRFTCIAPEVPGFENPRWRGPDGRDILPLGEVSPVVRLSIRHPETRPMIGEDLQVICEVTQNERYKNPTWYSTSNTEIEMRPPGSRHHIYSSRVSEYATFLYINNLQPSDRGTYSCRIRHLVSNLTLILEEYGSSTVTFTTSSPPVQGNEYSVICQISQPVPGVDVFWTTSDGTRIELPQQGNNNRVYSERLSNTEVRLTFRTLLIGDAGVYACNVGEHRFLHNIDIVQ
ncbi:Kielin/chordin-like protein [Holothuria leucospilota]|uniref:Kielin/chordin-like protein n=1 Tax=Holothuria leucospilota TaxID=206669 RepID=A0A9Q1H7C5_HOLLE|nr:Kielin/chordin-like protein [Holothuria leucospilota]